MKRFHSLLLTGILAITLGLAACSSSSNSGGGSTNTAIVDLAVGSDGTTQPPNVSIFFNILQFSPSNGSAYPRADVFLSAVTSGILSPSSVVLTSSDLVVCQGAVPPISSSDDTVLIFRNYASLTSASLADTTLTNGGSGISNPEQCLVDETTDTLIVTNSNASEVRLYPAFSAITAGTDPVLTPVILDNAGSLINNPVGIALGTVFSSTTSASTQDLYVANVNNTGLTQPCVSIFRDISTLASADAPDVQLSTGTSFLGDGFGVNGFCIQLAVGKNGNGDNNSLYVSTLNSEIYVFENADTLTSNALPDAVLVGDASSISFAVRPLVANNTLFAANDNQISELVGPPFNCPQSPAVVGFGPLHQFINGQAAKIALQTPLTGIANSTGIATAGGGFFVVGADSCNTPGLTTISSVAVFKDVSSLSSSSSPTLKIPGTGGNLTDLQYAVSLDAHLSTIH